MLSKPTISLIASLAQKKYRDQHKLFVAEGQKLVAELRARMKPHAIYVTNSEADGELISEAEMKKISFLKTPSEVLGVFHIPPSEKSVAPSENELTLALDGVQDPGNLGTIIRLCDWFGIDTLVCSPHTADCYNPKVVQATMGAIAHVRVVYADLPDFLQKAKTKNIPVYGTFLEGKNIYSEQLSPAGVVVMGSEGQGISPEVEKCVTHKLYIPSFAANRSSESLNVATAAAIACSEFRREWKIES
ncbi:MAG: RNA methyltransferase [Prevotellaceae bacterium]|jgi:TrmH family RNA methyltransferase|nr:RNA methyltransferase [Prevotellaceae bacterium]